MSYNTIPDLNPKDLQRFWNKVTKTGNCWEWVSSKTEKGYGQFNVNNKLYYVHRISYQLSLGIIPNDLQLDHLCRNPSCVNPEHLEVVTNQENMNRGHGNINKTHCPQGHEYTEDNTYLHKRKNNRICRICQRSNTKRWKKKECDMLK